MSENRAERGPVDHPLYAMVAEAAGWRGAPQPNSPAAQVVDRYLAAQESADLSGTLLRALEAELGDSYDCTRVWSAWSVGTMAEDDFSPVADRLHDIVDGLVAVVPGAARQDALNAAWRAVDALGGTRPEATTEYNAGRDDGYSRALDDACAAIEGLGGSDPDPDVAGLRQRIAGLEAEVALLRNLPGAA